MISNMQARNPYMGEFVVANRIENKDNQHKLE